MSQQNIKLNEIRDVATRFNIKEIAACQLQALNEENNACYPAQKIDDVMNVLAKAEFVRKEMNTGKKINEAIRELGKRMRMIQGA